MLILLLSLTSLFAPTFCFLPISTTRKPDFVITVPPQAVAVNSNSYASSSTPCLINPTSPQPPIVNINGYSQVRRNDFPNVLAQDRPINQNALVKPLIQAAKNNNRYASSAYVSQIPVTSIPIASTQNLPPINQNGLARNYQLSQSEDAPIHQNDLVKPLIEAKLSGSSNLYPQLQNQNSQLQGLNPQFLSRNPQLQGLNPQFQRQNPQLQGFNPQLQGLNPQLQGFNPQLQGLNPQLSAVTQNPLINQYSQVNQNQLSQGLPINQNALINSLPQGPPINQNALINSFPRRPINPALNVPPQNPQVNFPAASTFANRPQINGLEVAFQWQFLDWVHPTVQLTGKNFTVGNPLSQDLDIDKRGRVFVTSPQWLDGVPITLSVITDLKGPGGPLLTPYPDWTWHRANCDSLVSVFRVAIDECNRIWMVDTGFSGGQVVCPPKLLAFDLKTDQPILKYIIPASQLANNQASYVNPVVEVGNSCGDTHVYVADVLRHGLLVFSLRENRSWRLDNTPGNAFGNDPEAGRIVINGEAVDLTDGTLGVALSPPGFYSKRYLYFNSLASFYQKFADTDSLKRSVYTNSPLVYQSVARRVSQAGVHAISKTGAMFFQLAEYTALACWNIERPFTPENVVVLAQDPETLQYISGIKIITNALGEEELWFNTNRLQKTINNSRNINEVNYRLIHGKVEDLIKGTRCQPTGYTRSEPNLDGWKVV